jgi:hypothetical protein
MLLKTERNWKALLSPEDEQRLNGILEQIKKHRAAYLTADDVKFAQLWCALLEACRQNAALDARLKRLEFVLSGIATRAQILDKSADKLLESLGRF